jgi:hypothetical protein
MRSIRGSLYSYPGAYSRRAIYQDTGETLAAT